MGMFSVDENIHNLSTKELVDELLRREGVKLVAKLEPYCSFEYTTEGPAIVIEIID